LRPPPSGSIFATGLFDRTVLPVVVVTEIWNRAFIAGSSKHGKKRRASAASSWVKA
jgi:hypothetical protein